MSHHTNFRDLLKFQDVDDVAGKHINIRDGRTAHRYGGGRGWGEWKERAGGVKASLRCRHQAKGMGAGEGPTLLLRCLLEQGGVWWLGICATPES